VASPVDLLFSFEFCETKETTTVQEILEALGKLRVKKVQQPPMEVAEVKEEKEVAMKVEDRDYEEYTKVIKTLRPEPSDSPTKFGKFEVVVDEGKRYIISEKPLTFEEVYKVVSKEIAGEYYFEDTLIMPRKWYDIIVNRATKITYYTKDKLVAVGKSCEHCAEVIVELERIGRDGILDIVKIRGYVNTTEATNAWMVNVIKEIINMNREVIKEAMRKAVVEGKLEEMPRSFRDYVDYVTIISTDKISKDKIREIVENLRRLKKMVKVPIIVEYYHWYRLDVRYDNGKFIVTMDSKLLKEMIGDRKIDIDDPIVDEVIDAM